MKAPTNIYYRARMQAAQRDPLFASRERTAGEIFVSWPTTKPGARSRHATRCRKWWKPMVNPT